MDKRDKIWASREQLTRAISAGQGGLSVLAQWFRATGDELEAKPKVLDIDPLVAECRRMENFCERRIKKMYRLVKGV